MVQLIKMVKGDPIKWPNYLSEVCLSFLKGLLQKNPHERLSWPNLLYHPFLSFVFIPTVPGKYDAVCLARISVVRRRSILFIFQNITNQISTIHCQ